MLHSWLQFSNISYKIQEENKCLMYLPIFLFTVFFLPSWCSKVLDFIINFFLIHLFILLFYFMYLLFLDVLGLCCCARAFLWLQRVGATLRCGLWASHCSGFSCCRAWALGTQASVVVAHGLSSCGSWALEHRLSSCGSWA